jgi:hypothetical protein
VGRRRRGWGGFVFPFRFLDVSLHPSGIERVEESKEPFPLVERGDAFQSAVGFDFDIGEGEVASHAGHGAAGV